MTKQARPSRARILYLLAVLVVLPHTSVATADGPTPCRLAGPAGTASVVGIHAPHGLPSLALRVTTPTAVSPTAPATFGGRSSWHLLTQVALLRADTGRLVAHREVQVGSAPRQITVSAAAQEHRQEVIAPGLPFRHAAGDVPDFLPSGDYYLVAMGSDGSPAQPNPGWSVEAAFGTAVLCTPKAVPTTVRELDHTDFHGGTQLSAFGPGLGSGSTADLLLARRYTVGAIDAQAQVAGDVSVTLTAPRSRAFTVSNTMTAFSTVGRGRMRLAGDWIGLAPLVLVSTVSFDPP